MQLITFSFFQGLRGKVNPVDVFTTTEPKAVSINYDISVFKMGWRKTLAC